MNESNYKWYVYNLIDPRDNSVFYIGKGTRNRINYHEREARNKESYGSKVDRIRSIVNSGLNVIKLKIANFNCEQSAYNLESELIKSTDGLTNIVRNPQSVRKERTVYASFLDIVFRLIRGAGDKEILIRNLERFRSFIESQAKENTKHSQDYVLLFNCALGAYQNGTR